VIAILNIGKRPWAVPVILAIVTLAIRLPITLSAKNLSPEDTWRYVLTARNLVEHQVFSDKNGPFWPTAHDTPGYPMFLACLFCLVPDQNIALRAAMICNALLFFVSAWLLYFLALALTDNRKLALASAILFSFVPDTFWVPLQPMPDGVFATLFLSSSLAAVRHWKTGNPRWLLASACLLAVAVLFKPIGAFYAPLLFVGAAIFGKKRWWLHFAAAIALYAAVLSPWYVRNWQTFGAFGLCTIAGTNLWQWNCKLFAMEGGRVGNPGDLMAAESAVLATLPKTVPENPFLRSHAFGTAAVKFILRQPWEYLRFAAVRHIYLYRDNGAPNFASFTQGTDAAIRFMAVRYQSTPEPISPETKCILLVSLIFTIVLWGLFFFAVMGAFSIVITRNWLACGALLVPVFYFAALIGPVIFTRYRYQMIPFLAVLAVLGFSSMPKIFLKRRVEVTVEIAPD